MTFDQTKFRSSQSVDGMRRLLVGATVLANLFVFALVGYSLYESYRVQEQRAATQTQNLATTLVQNLTERLRAIDLALLAARDEFLRQARRGSVNSREMTNFLVSYQGRLPELEGLRITDAEGYIRYGMGSEDMAPVSLADRDYIRYQKENPEGGRFLGQPVQSRLSGRWVSAQSIRLNGPDGRFAGAVYATIRIDELTRLFSQLEVGPHGSLVLRGGDLGLITRYPKVDVPAGVIGNTLVSPEFRSLVDSGQTDATYTATNPSDGTHRIYTFQRLPNAPWYISAGLALEDYLEDWKSQAARYIGFAVLFLATSVLFARQVWKGWRKQLAVEGELRLAAIAFETHEGIGITDARSRFIRVNQAFSQVTGYSPAEVIGKTPAMLKSGRHDAVFYRDMWNILKEAGCWQGEIWNRRKNGEVFPQWMTITALSNDTGEVSNYVAVFQDISQRKQAEKQIQRLAFYDALTGLPNRALLMERIAQAMASSARQKSHGALLFIDLDNFKTLNDTLGHDKGDRLLIMVAERLKGCVRESDTVARLGGDEFVVMLEGLHGRQDEAANEAEAIGENIRATLDRTDDFNGFDHHSTPSIGVALFRGQESSVDEVLKRGDLAMYEAKAAGGNGLRFFDPAMQAVVETRARLEAEMRRALKGHEFVLHYQLQYDARGQAIGAEALVRWNHPDRGLVPPGEFIPLAESSGLILSIGEWVLNTACRQLAAWQANSATRHLRMAVNVSARQFRQASFADQVRSALSEAGADPAGLKLEITETLLVDDVDDAIAKMETILSMGVEFSLDDFGTGYSSLSYLKRLPLRQLKIDQSFVNDMLDSASDAAIIRTILALGQSLGMSVIAEGVETAAQRDFLAQLGCNAFQGYFFAKPAPIEKIRLEVAENA